MFEDKTILENITDLFSNLNEKAEEFQRNIAINDAIRKISKHNEFNFSLMSLYKTFTSKEKMIGFMIFLLICTALSYYLIYEQKRKDIKKFVYPLFLIALIKVFFMLLACNLISFEINKATYVNNDQEFINPFHLYNSFVLLTEILILFYLTEFLFSGNNLEKNIFYHIFNFFKLLFTIILFLLIFIAYTAPEYDLCLVFVNTTLLYLIVVFLLPVHFYYIYKVLKKLLNIIINIILYIIGPISEDKKLTIEKVDNGFEFLIK